MYKRHDVSDLIVILNKEIKRLEINAVKYFASEK